MRAVFIALFFSLLCGRAGAHFTEPRLLGEDARPFTQATKRDEARGFKDERLGLTEETRSEVLWAGWLPVMEERTRTVSGVTGVTTRRWFQWGADLSGTLDGAGGIGGLVGIIEEDGAGVVTRTLLPVQDGLGNITAVIDQATGRTVARYDYGPFGEALAESGEVDACPFRWQTKWYDAESQHYYFGYRHYDPRFGRWLSRDPLGEAGGFNLYAYCGNDPVNRHDPLGLSDRSIRPYGWFQLMFPATTGRDDLKGVACEGGLYGVYGILSTPGKIAAHPKIKGSLRMAGGGLEVGVGAVYSFGTEGIGAPLGGFALMANGADNFIAGFQSFRMGAYQPALLERGITSVAGNGWVGDGLYMATQLGVGFAPAIGARTERLALLLDWNPVFAPYRGGYAYSGVPLPGMPRPRVPISVAGEPLFAPSKVDAFLEANLTGSGRTVLGHYPEYIQKAQRTGASYFDIGDAWNTLTPAQRTSANMHFLDEVAGAGDQIYLSLPKSEIRRGSALADEIQYLTGEKGYQWINQWSLRPSGN